MWQRKTRHTAREFFWNYYNKKSLKTPTSGRNGPYRPSRSTICGGNYLQSSNCNALLSRLNFCNANPVFALPVVFLVPLILEIKALKCVLQLALLPSFAQQNINKRRATSPKLDPPKHLNINCTGSLLEHSDLFGRVCVAGRLRRNIGRRF